MEICKCYCVNCQQLIYFKKNGKYDYSDIGCNVSYCVICAKERGIRMYGSSYISNSDVYKFWEKSKIYRLKYKIKKGQNLIEELKEENEKLMRKLKKSGE